MTASTPQLDLRNPEGKRLTFKLPTLGVDAWRALTGYSEDDMLAEIENGKLRFAFNIARANADRMFVRLWNRSVICWIEPELWQTEYLTEAINCILPHSRPVLRCSELFRALNCSSAHILNLLQDGLIQPVAQSTSHPKQSPAVTRASVVRFLSERRIK